MRAEYREGERFERLTFTGETFYDCDFSDCVFADCTFEDCKLDHSVLTECHFQRCTVTSLEQNEDGTIALTYEQESGEKGIVTLKGSKGSYQFVSNKEA